MTKRLQEIHPGEILLEEFMKPMAITARRTSLTGSMITWECTSEGVDRGRVACHRHSRGQNDAR